MGYIGATAQWTRDSRQPANQGRHFSTERTTTFISPPGQPASYNDTIYETKYKNRHVTCYVSSPRDGLSSRHKHIATEQIPGSHRCRVLSSPRHYHVCETNRHPHAIAIISIDKIHDRTINPSEKYPFRGDSLCKALSTETRWWEVR